MITTEEVTYAKPRHIERFERYGALVKCWNYSRNLVDQLEDRLRDALSDNVVTVGLAGSFGRLEGSSESDADYILIVKDKERAQDDIDKIHDIIRSLNISPPNKSGVFAAPRTEEELVDKVGSVGESTDILGKRLLLLLESRAIYGKERHERLVGTIIDEYANYIRKEPTKEFAYLLNDLIRYFRFICVNYQSSFWRENEKWALRNLKLRHSRIIMYTGLLFVIAEASKFNDLSKIDFLKSQLKNTPLDRIAAIYEFNNDRNFFRVAGPYNVFVAKMSNPELRALLNVEYDQRYGLAEFAELKANSDALVAELLRFLMERRGDWTERFFEYLIF